MQEQLVREGRACESTYAQQLMNIQYNLDFGRQLIRLPSRPLPEGGFPFLLMCAR